MNTPAIEISGVRKSYRFFALDDVSLRLEQGQIMGFVGPNGAGKTTTIRILMAHDPAGRGRDRVLGHAMPQEQARAKWDIGFVSDDMSLFGGATLAWHMGFVKSIYPGWDDALREDAAQALPPAPGAADQGPVARRAHQGGAAARARAPAAAARCSTSRRRASIPSRGTRCSRSSWRCSKDDERSILFSSHNTLDVEQISDQITFIDRGRIVDSNDKEVFLDRWRRLSPRRAEATRLHEPPGVTDVTRTGHTAVVTTNAYSPELHALYEQAGATVRDVQRMTLEEIFVATVMHNRKERGE